MALAQQVQRLSQEAADLTEKADAKWRLRDSLLDDLLSRGPVPDPFIPNLYHSTAESFITSEPPPPPPQPAFPAEHALVAAINSNAKIFNKQLHERQDNPHGSGVTAQDIREQQPDYQLAPGPLCAGCGELLPHSGDCCPSWLDL